jgi:nucleotide-binding universal stress UspA family protein
LVSAERDRVALYYAPPKVTATSVKTLPESAVADSRGTLADSVFADALSGLPEAVRASTETIVGEQNPRRGLPLAADQWRADLTAVGAHGASTLGLTLLGSVARALVFDTTKPVLIARAKGAPRVDDTFRVIMAVEEVPTHSSATKLLEEISFPAGTQGRLVHVVEPLFGTEIPDWLADRARQHRDLELSEAWVTGYQAEKAAKEAALTAYSKKLPAAIAGLPPLVVEGLPAKKLLEIATADAIDLMILGTRGLSMTQRFLIGSTTEKLMTHAPCSLLVMHYGERP